MLANQHPGNRVELIPPLSGVGWAAVARIVHAISPA